MAVLSVVYKLCSIKTVITLRQLPPSTGALFNHLRRAIHVAVHVWGRAYLPYPTPVSPYDWDWKEENTCFPLWKSNDVTKISEFYAVMKS